MNKLFPTILIILDVVASVIYYTEYDWRKGTYWFAAAVLTFVITY